MVPREFVWGAATSSYQIEGAALEDGRGECIWTRFSHTPGSVRDNHNGDIAVDHYHRYPEDIALMKQLNLDAYRFSFSWPRILPAGKGAVNAKGLEFYDRLIDALLEANLQPYATLYHWDLPQALQDLGGWVNPEIPGWFADYTEIVVKHFADRVVSWATFNEPYVSAFVGYFEGRHAPGIRDVSQAYAAAHHLLLSHGRAVPIIRQHAPQAEVGIVLDIWPSFPATDSQADIDAAERFDLYHNLWFLEPVFNGHYPQKLVDYLGDHLHRIDDLSAISAAKVDIDFLGINYYTRAIMRHDDAPPFHMVRVLPDPDSLQTTMKWEIYPQGLLDTLTYLHETYHPRALYVTENGSAWPDPATLEGDVLEDTHRVDYLRQHLEILHRAIQAGVPLKGYFAWSLMDNFEWGHGYHQRFGLIHMDYATLKRTIKRSGLVYADHIAASKK